MVTGFEMAAALDFLSGSALEMDAAGASEDIRYTEDDAINALLIFMHIVNNVAIHKYEDHQTPMRRSLPHHIKQAKEMRKWFIRMVGVDPHRYFTPQIPNEQ